MSRTPLTIHYFSFFLQLSWSFRSSELPQLQLQFQLQLQLQLWLLKGGYQSAHEIWFSEEFISGLPGKLPGNEIYCPATRMLY